MPRGLGLATAPTSAAFFPHCEQRIRSASSVSVTFQPNRRARASGSTEAKRRKRSSHAPGTGEAVVEFLDVSEDPHPQSPVGVTPAHMC